MNAFCIEPFSDKRYDDFVKSHPLSSFFHSSEWARVLHDSYGFTPLCVSVVENDVITGLLSLFETRAWTDARQGVSAPFSDMCEPLLDNPDDFRSALDKCVQIGRDKRWRHIELRGGGRLLAAEPTFKTVYTHEIPLKTGEAALFKSFRSSTQRNIRNAEKLGIKVVHATSLEALRSFYRLNCLTRREHGLPPQPWKFFLNLWNTVLKADMGFITLASYAGKEIAGNLYLVHGKKALYKYGASDRAFQQLRASNLVMWEGIKKCGDLGCHSLNLGRTEAWHEGLLQFKRGFGCCETILNYYRYNLAQNRFVPGKSPSPKRLSKLLMSRLPIPMLRAIGALLYKYND